MKLTSDQKQRRDERVLANVTAGITPQEWATAILDDPQHPDRDLFDIDADAALWRDVVRQADVHYQSVKIQVDSPTGGEQVWVRAVESVVTDDEEGETPTRRHLHRGDIPTAQMLRRMLESGDSTCLGAVRRKFADQFTADMIAKFDALERVIDKEIARHDSS
ncbi:MAG: hypothetical protein OXH23_12330 [bacterium]|nr:hypothetical protein [bacterium]